ncbi:MAG: transporter substrate-binding domain-containing diguanylate cyclase, partial [Fusobacteriaceae bacterium]
MKKIVILLLLTLSTAVLGEKIRIGLIQNEFTQTTVHEKNLSDYLSGLLKEELKIPVEEVKGEWRELYEMFEKGELDMLAPVERTQSLAEVALFSENLYSQSFYVGSNSLEIREITQLQNKKIFTLKNTYYKEVLDQILKNADIKSEIIETDDIYEYGNEIVALPETLVQGLSSKFRVGVLPSTAIMAHKNQEENIAKINKILRNKYRLAIGNHKSAVEKEIRYRAFLRSLTPEEREYLKSLQEINVSYEEFAPVSTYLKEEKKYTGLTPIILEKISKNLDFKINVVNAPLDSWEKIFNLFKTEKSDLLSMAKTESREKRFLFSKKIMDLKIYKINTKNYLTSEEIEKIGVVKNSIEEDLAQKYYHPEEIISYTNIGAMSKDFKRGKLSAILTFDDKLVDGIDYSSEVFHYVPMNLAFSLKNRDLKTIFDKSLLYLIDRNSVIEEFRLKERELLQQKADMVTRYSTWLKILALLLCLGIYKIYHSKKMVELAFVDSLSKLGNRYSFEKFCESMKDNNGVAIVIDLDNFKNANDTYGHAVGDEIIAYCAQIFKKFFQYSRVFRISGDEYYAFIDMENHENMLKKLKKEIDERTYLKKHQIS